MSAHHPFLQPSPYAADAGALIGRATCEIAEGDKQSAARTLVKAIAWIDRTGKDREMRVDLEALKCACS